MASGRVLSIQSHVVRGYVGNKSATFPLQVLGFDVDAINSVQFSNHTQYKFFRGQVLKAEELAALVEGLRLNGMLDYSHLLTGYIGDPTFLRQCADVVKELKRANPNLIYVCDPVMGDDGRLYVPPQLVPIYRQEIVSLADIITPNQFEMEQLVGRPIHTEQEAVEAMRELHQLGPRTVVISSSELGDDKTLVMLASTRNDDGTYTAVRVPIHRLNAHFTGTGDLFAALFLARSVTCDFVETCTNVIQTMQAILKRTLASAQSEAGEGNVPRLAQLELRLVQSLDDIRDPPSAVPAVVVEPLDVVNWS